MGFGVSIFLIAVGAILYFAVDATVQGLDISTIGVILMIVGAIALVVSLVTLESWRGRRGDSVVEERVVRDERPRY
ncbi:hypothetical protein BH20ACT2_BH20ACT2_07960 [soil metagenome]